MADEASDKEQLEGRLASHGVPIGRWGEGASKTFNHLLNELREGESILESQDAELLRKFKVVGIEVLFKDTNGKTLRLREDKQVFTDGREKKRRLDVSLAEKMKPGETPYLAAKRAILEELGISSEIELLKRGEFHITKPSESFPGLTSDYNAFMYETTLSRNQFKSEGYQEVQPDKTTYFIWEETDKDIK